MWPLQTEDDALSCGTEVSYVPFLFLRAPFTAVSVHIERFIHEATAGLPKARENVLHEKFQDVKGAVSGKEYIGHCHLQIYLACKHHSPAESDSC